MGCVSSSPTAGGQGGAAAKDAANANAAAAAPTSPSARRPYPRVVQQQGARNPLLEESGGTNTDSFLPPQRDFAFARPGTVTDPAAVIAAGEQQKAFDALLPRLTEPNLELHQRRLVARRQTEIDAVLAASAASHAPTITALSFYKAVELLDMWLDGASASLGAEAHAALHQHLPVMPPCPLDNASLGSDDGADDNDRTLVSAGGIADEDLRLFQPSPPFAVPGHPEL